ncbi:hypothetical protein Tco_1214231 [Tanacetum coccineum]
MMKPLLLKSATLRDTPIIIMMKRLIKSYHRFFFPSVTPLKRIFNLGKRLRLSTYPLRVFSNLDDIYYDTEGDILYLEKLLNEDPSLTLPPMKNDDLKQVDVTMTKPSIEEPPELELKDLPSHLEYAFLEGTDKLPVIISKELKR